MGVRSLIAHGAERVAKAFGPGVPESFQRGEEQSQMTPASPFSPGQPIGPYDGYDRTPRSHDFVTGYNIATRPRIHERVSFETLSGLIDAYDVSQICIRHRISSLRSLDWKLISAEGYTGDITDAIPYGMAALKRPDRKTLFKSWLAKYLWDVLAYDAGTMYRMRNRGGRVVGLKVIDGRMVAPLLDYWGDIPDPPAEGFVQFANGLPWNWLTRDDIIYEPYDPIPGSVYGRAPIETIILNANTDIRFQLYFLGRFTEGNLPAAFASSPESWSPDQIEQFQSYWDSFMYGDQSRKHQIRWMPGGSKIAWSNEKDFNDTFSLFMMRKTCASYHVVPSDLGFTQDVNRSSGESQADVQHKVGDLPLAHHVQDILSAFLQDDLQLPLRFAFDLGEEQDDRYQQAQADQIYMDRAVVSVSEIREMRYGLPEPAGTVVPRVFFTERAGPIPLSSVEAVSGPVDTQTAAPQPGAPLPHEVFGGTPGVIPEPPIKVASLAERMYGEAAMPPAPPQQPKMPAGGDMAALPAPVAKEGEGAPASTAGITSETGLYSYDLAGRDDDEDEDQRAELAKSEHAAFRRFERSRRKLGVWRDFTFTAVDPVTGHRLNDAGRLAVRKAAGEVAVAGLAVLAADTGRVLMLQRALCDDDPAAGTWEFPGGHLEQGETPLAAAWREWSEETGLAPPPGVRTGSWTSPDGVYQGIVWTADAEAMVPVRSDTAISNPDDPDGDSSEAIAWWNPADLPGNPVVRSELLANIDAVLAALGVTQDCCGAECCAGACCGGADGCGCGAVVHDPSPADDGVAKAGGAAPKARDWPGWQHDLAAAEHWAPKVTSAILAALPASKLRQIARDYLAGHQPQEGTGKRELNDQATAWLREHEPDLAAALAGLIAGILADAYLIGAVSAAAVTGGTRADTGGWQPGDTSSAEDRIGNLGLSDDYASTADGQSQDRADEIAGGIYAALGRTLADGLQGDASPDDLGDDMEDTAGDTALATGLLTTVITGISSLAAKAWYWLTRVQYGTWLSAQDGRVCAICQGNEDAGAVPMGDPYPSGDAWAPIHPRCRCAVVPADQG